MKIVFYGSNTFELSGKLLYQLHLIRMLRTIATQNVARATFKTRSNFSKFRKKFGAKKKSPAKFNFFCIGSV